MCESLVPKSVSRKKNIIEKSIGLLLQSDLTRVYRLIFKKLFYKQYIGSICNNKLIDSIPVPNV